MRQSFIKRMSIALLLFLTLGAFVPTYADPGDLTATASGTKVDLVWEDEDPSLGGNYFEVFRATDLYAAPVFDLAAAPLWSSTKYDVPYSDPTWGAAADGVYQWALRVTHGGGTTVYYSNMLDKGDMKVENVTVAVELNPVATPAEGAEVTVTSVLYPERDVYTGLADENGDFEIPELRLGEYNIAVSYPGFIGYTATELVDTDDQVIVVALDQHLIPVSNLKITPTALATWDIEPYAVAVEMEDFGTVNNGPIPAGWDNVNVSGTLNDGSTPVLWTVKNVINVGTGTPYTNDHTSGDLGTGMMARFHYSYSSDPHQEGRLIMPEQDFSLYGNPYLHFWHIEAVTGTFKNELRVVYSVDAGATWTTLAEFIGDDRDWHDALVQLPREANCLVAFESKVYRNQVAVDDVTIYDGKPGSSFIGDNGLPTSYNVYLGPTGTVLLGNTTDKFFQIEVDPSTSLPLADGTNYDVWVKAIYETGDAANVKGNFDYAACDTYEYPAIDADQTVGERSVTFTFDWTNVTVANVDYINVYRDDFNRGEEHHVIDIATLGAITEWKDGDAIAPLGVGEYEYRFRVVYADGAETCIVDAMDFNIEIVENGTIEGLVKGNYLPGPVAISGVTVTLLDENDEPFDPSVTATTVAGAYSFSVEPGTYGLLFEVENYISQTISGIIVTSNKTETQADVLLDWFPVPVTNVEATDNNGEVEVTWTAPNPELAAAVAPTLIDYTVIFRETLKKVDYPMSVASTETSFTYNLDILGQGVYTIGVRANYHPTGNNSDTVYAANLIDYDIEAKVTMNVTLNAGDEPENVEVKVTFKKLDEAIADRVEIFTSSQMIIDDLRKGAYEITLECEKYDTQVFTESIWGDVTYNWFMEEGLYQAFDLEVSPTAKVSWTPGDHYPLPPAPLSPLPLHIDFETDVFAEGWTETPGFHPYNPGQHDTYLSWKSLKEGVVYGSGGTDVVGAADGSSYNMAANTDTATRIYLFSPVWDFSNVNNPIEIAFQYGFAAHNTAIAGGINPKINVAYRTSDGGAWTHAFTTTEQGFGSWHQQAATLLPDAAGAAYYQIRFEANGKGTPNGTLIVGLDELYITENAPTPSPLRGVGAELQYAEIWFAPQGVALQKIDNTDSGDINEYQIDPTKYGLVDGDTYDVGVVLQYATGHSAQVTTSFVYTPCDSYDVAENFEAVQKTGSRYVTLTWENPATPAISAVEFVRIYAADTLHAELSDVETFATAEELAAGDHTFYIQYVYADGAETCYDDMPEAEVTVISTGSTYGFVYANLDTPVGINGVTVTFTNADGNEFITTTENDPLQGYFIIEDIEEGAYTVSFAFAPDYIAFPSATEPAITVYQRPNSLGILSLDPLLMDEFPYAPTAVVAVVDADDEDFMNISWTAPTETPSEGLMGYELHVYDCRDNDDEIWSEFIAVDPLDPYAIEEYAFDMSILTDDYGVYAFGLEAMYYANRSEITETAACTDHNMLVTVDGTVTMNTGLDTAEGVVVTFESLTEMMTYEATLGADGAFEFAGFRKGVYDITVEKVKFVTITETNVTIDDDETFDWMMLEGLYNAENLNVTPMGYFTWSMPTRGIEYANIYLDGISVGTTEGTDNHTAFQFDESTLVSGETYTAGVQLEYTTGLSASIEEIDFIYRGCAYYDDVPTAFTAVQEPATMDVKLAWTNGETTDVAKIIIYRDGKAYETLTSVVATWIDEDVEAGTYEYELQYIYEDGAETCLGEAVATAIVKSVGTIEGLVVFAIDGEPVEGATITLSKTELSYTMTTDEDGEYKNENIEAGIYTLEVEFTGYISQKLAGITVTELGTTFVPTIELMETPTPVANVTATIYEGTVYVAWDGSEFPTRGLVGYNVYRTGCYGGAEELLTFLPATTGNYTDTQWSELEIGVYKWGVECVYDLNESDIVYSNCVDKDMEVEVKATVALITGESPVGTKVTFTNISEPELDIEYTTTLTATGTHTFVDFRRGTYEVAVEKTAYVSQEDVKVIVSDTAFAWTLQEAINAPIELYVTPTALATWKADVRAIERYKVFMDDIFVTNTTATTYQFDVTNLVAEQEYKVDVLAEYTMGQSEKATYTFTYIPCDEYAVATDFTATQVAGKTDAKLEWTNPAGIANVDYMRLYRNGDLYKDELAVAATYTDANLAVGTYAYELQFVYKDGAETCIDDMPTASVTIVGTGTINGTVTKLIDGAVVEGATITVTSTANTYTATTDAFGKYEVTVAAGAYELTAAATGFVTAEGSATVAILGTKTVDFVLYETPYPVANVTATPFNNYVYVSWDGTTSPTRGLVGYNIYRTDCYGGDLVYLGNLPATAVNHTDYTWENLASGVYKWGVVAVYDENESEVAYSNCLDKDMTVEVDVKVTLNTGESPAGAKVAFTNTSEPELELVYQVELSATGTHTFEAFRKGTYDIVVSNTGYATKTATEAIYDDASFTWNLIESLSEPSGLFVSPTAYASWEAAIPEEDIVVTIGEGTTTTYEVPINNFWKFSYVQQIFDAAEIGQEKGKINSIAFQYNAATPFTNEITIYLANTDKEVFASTSDWVAFSELTEVFKGEVTFANTNDGYWVTIEFDAPFNYTGGNLVVATLDQVDGYPGSSRTFYRHTTTGNKTLSSYRDSGGAISPEAPISASYAYVRAFRNNVQFGMRVPMSTRALEEYRVYLDGVYVASTLFGFHQYDVTTLVAGQEYLSEVAIKYTTGYSDRAAYTWTYTPCDEYDAPTNVTATQEAGSTNVVLTWTNPDLTNVDFLRVYRNGVLHQDNLSMDTPFSTWTDAEVDGGTYTYALTFVYDDKAETCIDAATATVTVVSEGTINGTVTYALGGAPVNGATITVSNTNNTYTFTTGANGKYTGTVASGNYTVTAALAGHETATETATIAHVSTVTVDFVLYETPVPVEGVTAWEENGQAIIAWDGTTPGPGPGTGETFEEGFEAGNIPTGWVIYDADNDNYNWENTAVNYNTFEANTGSYCMTSASYVNYVGPLTPNNYLVTPDLALGSGASELKFWIAGQDPSYSAEKCFVKVSTTGNAVADFTTTLHTVTATAAWSEITVDLSAYAGQTIYLAFVHTDVTDQYFLKLDDVSVTNVTNHTSKNYVSMAAPELTASDYANSFRISDDMSEEVLAAVLADLELKAAERAANATRGHIGYNIYRTGCYEGDLELLASLPASAGSYIDSEWSALEPAVYKWAVEKLYDLNESELVYSNCLSRDMNVPVSVTVALNSGDSPEGTTVLFTNVSEPGSTQVYSLELDETGYYMIDAFRRGTYDIVVSKAGYATIELTEEIAEATDFVWVLQELINPATDLVVGPTGFATWKAEAGGAAFNGFHESFDEGIPDTWTVEHLGSAPNVRWKAVNEYVYYSVPYTMNGTPFVMVDMDGDGGSGQTTDDMLTSPVIDVSSCSELYLSFIHYYRHLTAPAAKVDVYDGSSWVNVYAPTTNSHATPWTPTTLEIDVTPYINKDFQVRFNYTAASWVWYWAIDEVMLSETPADSRAVQSYKVWLDGIFCADTNVPYYQHDVTTLVEGEEYTTEVAVVYSTGVSEKASYTWIYESCENYPNVTEFNGEAQDLDVKLTWTFPGSGPISENIVEDVESHTAFAVNSAGEIGWSYIDGDAANTYGFNGISFPGTGGSMAYIVFDPKLTTPEMYSTTPTIHAHSGDKFFATFAANPAPNNDWIISPALTSPTKISFWAKSYMADYGLERFKVGYSTTGTAQADFTIISAGSYVSAPTEWTLYEYDLPSNAKHVAINCVSNDAFIFMVDDITIEMAGKSISLNADNFNTPVAATSAIPEFAKKSATMVDRSNSMAEVSSNFGYTGVASRAQWDLVKEFNLNAGGEQGIATDGEYIYTAFWGTAGKFSKYDMEGTYIEDFTISGGGATRDITYDGEYFYTSAGSTTIYKYDLANKTLVGTITSAKTARHISHDPATGGFYVGDWNDLSLISSTGSLVSTCPAPTSAYGSAYYAPKDGSGPYILLNTQDGGYGTAYVYTYDISANTMSTTYVNVAASMTGIDPAAAIAGGAFTANYGDKLCFFANIQQTPNKVGIFELEEESITPPEPSEEISGVNIYRNGEMIAYNVQGNQYTDVEVGYGEYEYCIEIVYVNNALSCGTCIDVEVAYPCFAPENLAGDYVWIEETNYGAQITWGAEPIEEWLYYDNGVNEDAIGGPASFIWAVKFTPAQLADLDGTSLTKIMTFKYAGQADDDLQIYQGTNAAELLHTQKLSGLTVGTYEEVALTSPVSLDVTKELWIAIATTNGANWPAATSTYSGNPNGAQISQDGGASWANVNDLGVSGTWMLRGYVTNARGVEMAIPMEKPAFPISTGTFASRGKGHYNEAPVMNTRDTDQLQSYNVYRRLGTTGEYAVIANVPAVEGQAQYDYFDNGAEPGQYYYQVTALYAFEDGHECESTPALSAENPANDYVIVNITDIGENFAEARVYPNPAKNAVTIEASNMNRITVVSVLGQVVYDAQVDGSNTERLDVSQFEAGVYVLRIAAENGVSTKRITVVR